MSAKHTPGPWVIDHIDGDPLYPYIKAGEHISHGFKVAYRIAEEIGGRTPNGDQSEVVANAHLIAAAPDMLATLYEIVGVADDYMDFDPDSRFGEAIARARATIAKAEGEQQ